MLTILLVLLATIHHLCLIDFLLQSVSLEFQVTIVIHGLLGSLFGSLDSTFRFIHKLVTYCHNFLLLLQLQTEVFL
jgi:hypothetical protein